MKPLTFDIETSSRPDSALFIEEPTAPSNYRDPAKVAAYIEERRAQQMERCALDASTARVLCVGILREGAPPEFIHDDASEAKLLERTWETLGVREHDEVLVGFNSIRFDIPMLIRRSYALNVRIPGWCVLNGRWPAHVHVDVYELWQAGDRTASISLDRLARLCGLPGKDSNGGDFARLWREDREAALKYLQHDLELTEALWRRMR